MATIAIEFDDGTVAYIEVDDHTAERIGEIIEARAGRMNIKT